MTTSVPMSTHNNRMPSHKADVEARRNYRRSIVADAVLAGRTYRQIKKLLGEMDPPISASLRTIQLDVEWARDQWAEAAATSIERQVSREEAKLDLLERGFWPAAMSGEIQSGRMILGIMGRRAALKGLDKPTRQEVKITAGLSIDEFEANMIAEAERALSNYEEAAVELALREAGVLNVGSTVRADDGDADGTDEG